ncbi:MAG: shikimate dehydrogenase [Chitinophagales bacterium]|nr:shikimate dehydrogenase [Chitinophagales bacterium]
MDNIRQVDRLFGLIGYPLSHSFSKKYFSHKFEKEDIRNSHYELFPLEDISLFQQLTKDFSNLKGLNVTIPYKQAVIPYLDHMDEGARMVGAVNTIKIENGQLTGYNTDVYGFEYSLRRFLEENNKAAHSVEAFILGTGGAAKAVVYVLNKMNIPYQMVSRKDSENNISYEMIDKSLMEKYHLIINTTPLGMSPNEKSKPLLPYEHLSTRHLLYDLVYNPTETAFMKAGTLGGAAVKNGLEMLHLQAEKAWSIWNNID